MTAYRSDVTDEQWAVLAPLLVRPVRRVQRTKICAASSMRSFTSRTPAGNGLLPAEFGLWTRIWSQFRRWTVNGAWPRDLGGVHRAARLNAGRTQVLPSMIVIDTVERIREQAVNNLL